MVGQQSPLFPPLDGSISVIPGFIDFQAKHNPDLPCAIWPKAGSETDETGSVSFVEFAEASERIAHHLRPGRHGPEDQLVAILINADSILYCALIVACIRAGLIVRL